jgi:ABC-type multidrug transport system fused ATPase/permease subunit
LQRLIKNIWQILTSLEKRRLIFIGVSIFIMNIVDIGSLALLVLIVNFYTSPNGSIPAFIPSVLANKQSLQLIAYFLFFFCIKSIAGYFVSRFQFKFIYHIASRLSGENLLRYLEGSFSDYVNIDSAVQIRQISQQPVEFAHYILSGLLQMFTEFLLILLTILAILIYDARLFLLLLLMLVPAVILVSYFARRKLRDVKAHVKSSGEKAIQYLHEALSGYVESNIYDKNSFFTKRYADYQRRLNDYLSDLQVIQGLPARSVEVFAVLGLFILLAANQAGGSGLVSILTIGAFIAAAYKIIPGMVKIVNLNNQVKTYSFTAEKLGYRTSGRIKNTISAIEKIEFRSVGFRYKEETVLDNINLVIKKGEIVGMAAPSGKGKSTLINLLLGFLNQNCGDIYINNKLASASERQQYWNEIAYVKQQPFLIHNSILANVLLDEQAQTDERLHTAIRRSGLDQLVGKNGEGLHAIVTENGKNISGGQRQRIALARALYRNASLIILDEPFNEMDEASELNILKHLQEISAAGKMVMLITHNSRSLSYCNRVFYLHEK